MVWRYRRCVAGTGAGALFGRGWRGGRGGRAGTRAGAVGWTSPPMSSATLPIALGVLSIIRFEHGGNRANGLTGLQAGHPHAGGVPTLGRDLSCAHADDISRRGEDQDLVV